MFQFIKTIFFLCFLAYGAKTATNVVTHSMSDPENQEKMKQMMSVVGSVNDTIEIRGEKIEMDGDVDVMELYRRAQKEADHMMKTGDFSVYQEQLDKNKGFVDMIKKMEEKQKLDQNSSNQ